MKNLLGFLFIFLSTQLAAQQYKLAEGYKVAFTNPDVSGTFDELSATSLIFNEADLSKSKLSFKIKVASINTGNGLQNKHARAEEWFDAEKYPYIEFTSSRIEKTQEGYKAVGKLEIKGEEKEVSIPFSFTKKGSKGTFVAKFSVNRNDFGVGKKNAGVADNIKISATIPVIKK
ncbi:MAG: YceI family protein [Flavobacteriales bacterium]